MLTYQMIFIKKLSVCQPPAKPNVTAMPGDQKVTYWDAIAERL